MPAHSAPLFQPLQLFAAAAQTSGANGAPLTIADYDGLAIVAINVGAVAGTTPTLVVKLQTGPNTGAFADMPKAFSQTITATGLYTFIADLGMAAQVLRQVSTITGTSPSFTYSTSLLAVRKVR